jgi:hypothetical protein
MRCGSPILPIGLDSTWIDSIWLNAICCLSLQHCCACRFLRVLSVIQSQLPSLLVRSMSWHIRFNDDRFRTGRLLPVISGCRKVFQNATLTLWRAPRVGRRFPWKSMPGNLVGSTHLRPGEIRDPTSQLGSWPCKKSLPVSQYPSIWNNYQ